MLDIIEVAEEKGFERGEVVGLQKGIQEGKTLGIQEGKTLGIQEGELLGLQKGLQEMIVDTLMETVKIVPAPLAEQIRTITSIDVLKGLHRQAIKCTDLKAFEALLQQVV